MAHAAFIPARDGSGNGITPCVYTAKSCSEQCSEQTASGESRCLIRML
jgi:hypothetical protein